MDNHTNEERYDFIIVGSGAGGGPLAANLAKAGYTVCLLEAGGDSENYNYQVPAFHTLASEDDALKWDFFVRHYADEELQARDEKYVKEKKGVLYPRCSTLGGCTAHHAMIIVYPHNSDWDDIAELMDDDSWNSTNMRHYFERLERNRYRWFQRALQLFFGKNWSRHGFDGWLTTTKASPLLIVDDTQLFKTIKNSVIVAFATLSSNFIIRFWNLVKALADPNDWRLVKQSAEGIRAAPLSIRAGRRAGTREYIREVQKAHPDRLTVKLHALASRVLFDDDNKATGVEYIAGEHLYEADPNAAAQSEAGAKRTVKANREVILSGGAFNSPQLLKLSGIGPKDELGKHGIDVRIDLPGVGENLQDRYEVGIVTEMKKDFSLLKGATFQGPTAGEPPDPKFSEWLAGKGVYTTNGAVISIIKKSNDDLTDPDLFIFGLAAHFEGYFPGYSNALKTHFNRFTWAVLKAHTNNTAGRVTLQSNNPRAVPCINFSYFDEGNDASGEDLEAVVEGVEFVRTMNRFAGEHIARETVPGPNVKSRDDIRRFVKDNAWGHHASCTNKMGPKEDLNAVVDSDFRVHGTQNLRIVDASIFPKIPGFFIVTSVYMISEKASDVIIADARKLG